MNHTLSVHRKYIHHNFKMKARDEFMFERDQFQSKKILHLFQKIETKSFA
jgi:hypothetical protein